MCWSRWSLRAWSEFLCFLSTICDEILIPLDWSRLRSSRKAERTPNWFYYEFVARFVLVVRLCVLSSIQLFERGDFPRTKLPTNHRNHFFQPVINVPSKNNPRPKQFLESFTRSLDVDGMADCLTVAHVDTPISTCLYLLPLLSGHSQRSDI